MKNQAGPLEKLLVWALLIVLCILFWQTVIEWIGSLFG